MNINRTTSLPTLESVLCTEELNRRPARPPDFETESRALAALTQALAESPRTILQTLADTILEVFDSGSAGISLVTEDGTRFHWPAIAGVWKPHLGGGTPRDFGPCGDVLDRNVPLLFTHFERRYTYLQSVMPPAEECLLVPFYVKGKAVGTIWAITHDDRPGARRFDREDLRMLVSLGTFASAAYQAVEQLHVHRQQAQERREDAQDLREMNDALLVASVRQHELAEQAQKAEAAASRLAAIVASSEDAIISKTLDGIITSWNESAERLYGYTANEVVGKSVALLIPPGRVDEEPHILERIRAGEAIEHFETVRQRKDGSLLDISLTVSPLRDAAGRIIGASAIARDITQRMLLEQTTKDLAKSLADLHRRKDEFLAMLSHELRNPLAPIQNAVHLLRLQQDRSPLQVEAHGMIDRQVAQLARLVDDLLEVSRITSGRVHLQEARVDFRGTVDRAIEATQPQADQKGQSVAKSLPNEPIWVYGDPVRLEQVVVNLFNNACKYTDWGGQISVGLKQDGGEAILRVRDTGVGIAPEMLPRIFDLFTQVDKSLDRSQGGLGIGLALVQSLVTMHRGRVEVQSTPGQGSEFIVHLPVLLSPLVTSAVPVEHAPPPTSGLKVLVVDDNVDAAKSVAMLLRISGHDVRLAYDGASAMQAALEHVPEVVLLDIGLPVVDGYQVAKWFRQEPALRDVVLVALTGYGQESDQQLSREAGFDHHLVKPVDFARVKSILSIVAEKAQ